MGGQRTLQRKWTSFLKARLDCSFPEPSLPPIVQDVFLLKHKDWRESVFYAVFTPQSYVFTVRYLRVYSSGWVLALEQPAIVLQSITVRPG